MFRAVLERALDGAGEFFVHPHALLEAPPTHLLVTRLAHAGPDDARIRLTTASRVGVGT